MTVIRCTAKLQKEMGLKKSDLADVSDKPSSLQCWHANLIYICGRKCVLFVNDRTLFNFIAPDVSRADCRQLNRVFAAWLPAALSHQTENPEILVALEPDFEAIIYGATNSKSILGSMNELAWHYKAAIEDEGSIHSAMVPTIIKNLNRMPMKDIEFKYPIKRLEEEFSAAT